MGLLFNGKWVDQWYDTKKTGGKFIRESAQFRNSIKADINSQFPAESGRYHLYVSLACPWAHRTLIFRALKDLTDHISISVVHPHMLSNGWEFKQDFPEATGDTLYNKDFLYELYTKVDANCSGRVTVPLLWDKKNETIVSNESSEIIRMFNTEFNDLTGNELNFYPKVLQHDIDKMNQLIYDNINNGVYKCGFATTQEAYDSAIEPLFDNLTALDNHLAKHNGPYLFQDKLTEADWRLFTTLIRFDAVYVGHFKCNVQRIADYEFLSKYLSNLYHHPGIRSTVNFEHIKSHYYYSHTTINPYRIIPKGPKEILPLSCLK